MKSQYILGILFIICTSCLDKKQKDDNPVLGDEMVTFVVQDVPKAHDFDGNIYISGDFEGWSGGTEKFKLKKENQNYCISIPKYKETISYKFTKGDWGTVECKLNGNPIENRTYAFEKPKDTVWVSILNWNDKRLQNKPSTAAENVQVFDGDFKIPQLKRKRKISLYLPPNYETSTEHYPVLYIQDGQNVFDVSTSYAGEWEVDETLNKLYDDTGFGLIVVAVDHGGNKRLNEYSAWDNKTYGKGEGEAFLNFLTETLKPEIDATFRTKKDAENTAIMGASLGGLFAHYAAIKKPDVFGKAGIFSPSFWYSESVIGFTAMKYNSSKSRLYYLVGDKEGKDMVKPMKDMIKLMKEYGFPGENIHSNIVPNGTHSESLWKDEFEEAITWLFDIKSE